MDQQGANNRPMIVVVMGVSGCGKSTVSTLLAARLGWQFQEGDALHPPENVEKMRGGTPLTDADRIPWLRRIARKIDDWRRRGESGVLTCSALKRTYREIIVVRRRLDSRHDHFMPPALLDSQFSILQEPSPDENPIVVDIARPPDEIVGEIAHRLRKFDS
jgi:gluconokinase